jgi:hypothetical protein
MTQENQTPVAQETQGTPDARAQELHNRQMYNGMLLDSLIQSGYLPKELHITSLSISAKPNEMPTISMTVNAVPVFNEDYIKSVTPEVVTPEVVTPEVV